MNPQAKTTTRREFLTRAGAGSLAALSIPYFVRSSALGLDGAVAPSDRIVMGTIGTGGKGRSNMRSFMEFDDVQMIAVCDVDEKHLDEGLEMIHEKYDNQDGTAYRDFRELLARGDIDAVSVATPDHWHALATIAAANASKDIYCEKPLANSIGEGRAICEAVKANNRILQTGSHERSGDNARFACELVRNGRIGKVHTIQVNLPCGDDHHEKVRQRTEMPATMEVPEDFNYDMWLGHTPMVPYTEQRCHFYWRFILAYGGGEMTDRGAHVIDLAQLGAGTDNTGPVEIMASGHAAPSGLYDVFWNYTFVNRFADGLRMVGVSAGPRGVRFEGPDGWVFIHVHGGKLEAEPASLLEEKIGDSELSLGRSPGHHRNFVDSVKSRQDPVAPAEVGHRTATICHLNNIAMKLARPIKWNPEREQIVDDEEANALLVPTMRTPWTL